MDEYFAGASFWLWKEESQGSWGLFDHDAATDAWTERAAFVSALSRPHASRVAGTPSGTEWNAAARSLTVRYDGAIGAPNVLWVGPAHTVVATLK